MLKFHYFNGKLNQGFTALFTGRMIQFVAAGLTGLFVPIFLLNALGLNVIYVFIYFLICHTIYAISLPSIGKFLNRIGYRTSLRLSVFFDAAFYACLFLTSINKPVFLVLSLFFVTLCRITFWLPYHIDFAKFTDKLNRCKEVSLLWAVKSFLSIIMPLLSGFMVGLYGFNILFIMTVILSIAAIIPFFYLPKTNERFDWTYKQTLKHFFSKNNRKLIMSNMANGAENEIAMVVWPIFIWQVLKGNYFAVGAISSMIVFVTVILQLAVGKYADLFSKRKMLRWGSVLYAIGWFIKIFVLTTFQTFIAGSYHSFTQIFKDTPFDSLNYELLADKGHYVDEYTVVKEMAVQYGKVIMLLVVILVASKLGMNWTFGLAGLASLLINFI
jgi:MFS family permease